MGPVAAPAKVALERQSPSPRDSISAQSDDTLVERTSTVSTLAELPPQRTNMASASTGLDLERRRSHGIGGAGNIRQ